MKRLLLAVLLIGGATLAYAQSYKYILADVLDVKLSIDPYAFKRDMKEKGFFYVKYRITNISQHTQPIDIWTGCSASNWVSDMPEIVPGIQNCDKNYCSGRMGDYPPGQYLEKKMPVHIVLPLSSDKITFRLAYYPCFDDPKDLDSLVWSAPITITIEPEMLKNLKNPQ